MPRTIILHDQIEGIYASGGIASTTGDQVQTLYPTASNGLTFNGSNIYTVTVKGIYYIHGQKLVANGAAAIYLGIDINGGRVKHGYVPGSVMADVHVTELRELNVGDTIRFYQQNATSSAWENPHSSYQIFLIKRT